MNKSRIYFAVFSVITLVVLAVSPMKDYFSEWKSYQHNYNDIIKNLPKRIPPAEIGIKQIWVRKLNRVDRCITCHLGLKENALANARQPFTTHPQIYHDFEDYGCTICHDGQGPATTYEESVGKVKFWEEPILPDKYMEASCGKCHKEKEVTDAPILNLGRKLIEESNCVGCHVIPGYDRQWVPNLNGIGSKVNKSWLFHWLKNPQKYFPNTKMPDFKLSDEEAYELTEFLMTFKSFPSNIELEPLPKQLSESQETQNDKFIELGSTKFKEARCISCHSINGRGGYAANDLGKVAGKVNEQWLYNYIKHPKLLQPGVVMPRFRFDDGTLSSVVAYIESEFADNDMKEVTFPKPEQDFYKKGQDLFEKYNCGGCHELGNFKRNEGVAPDLTFIGSKKLYEIDFGNSDIEQTVPSYIFTKLKDPRIFLPTMKMPVFSFTNEEVQAVTTALLANTNDNIPEQLKVNPKPPSLYSPQGNFGKLVNDLACLGCHKMFGKGRLVATDLSLEGSKAQKEWIENYFKVPYSLRPILTERMPNFFLPDSEIAVLTDYIENIFIADSLDHNIITDDAKIEKGRMLYYEKYSCQSCHQINLKGGFVGPALDKVGSRLKPGWIFHWLKNPQSLVPETIEPNNNLTNEEAEELTAFLLSLK
jgi:mono/diheme cytochrome c family protein